MPCNHHQESFLLKTRIDSASHEVYSVAAEVCPSLKLCVQQPSWGPQARSNANLHSKPFETAENPMQTV